MFKSKSKYTRTIQEFSIIFSGLKNSSKMSVIIALCVSVYIEVNKGLQTRFNPWAPV